MKGATVAALLAGAALLLRSRTVGEWTPPEGARPFLPLFVAAEARYNLPPGLLSRVAWQESRFRADIIRGETRSSAGAIGIMQIIPRWHPELGEEGALDPERAIPYAAKYLRDLHEQFGEWRLALAAYNWGPGNVSQALQNGVPVWEWPRETREYMDGIARDLGLLA